LLYHVEVLLPQTFELEMRGKAWHIVHSAS